MQSFIKASLGCIRDKTGSILCLSGTRIKLKKKEFSESWTRFSLFFALFARVDNFLNMLKKLVGIVQTISLIFTTLQVLTYMLHRALLLALPKTHVSQS